MTLFIAGVASTFIISVVGLAFLALRAPLLDATAFPPKLTKHVPRARTST